MTKEELLRQRYKVTAPWPGTHWKPGEIFEYDNYNCFKTESQPSIPLHGSVFEAHPHLFKPLHWADERKIGDMPLYVIWTYGNPTVHKVRFSFEDDAMYFDDTNNPTTFSMWITSLEPATQEEYEAYIKRKEDQQ